MPTQANTILLIADISGYTSFMKQHAVSVTHAKQIIVRLLKTLMQTAKPPLKVAELEGDAVFFYARAERADITTVALQVKEQVIMLFSAFNKELAAINSITTCPCDACHRVSNLQLKQVIHAGNVEIEQIEQFEKLFGLDVILVHRLLKNSVPSNEYVMMTNPMYECCTDFYGLQPERFKESLEGVGEVETLVFYPKDLSVVPIPHMSVEKQPASFSEKLQWRAEQTVSTVGVWLGLVKFKGEFKSVPA